jgi:hypothetical protein
MHFSHRSRINRLRDGLVEIEQWRFAASRGTAFRRLDHHRPALRHQQNLTGRRLAILALPTTNGKIIKQNVGLVVAAVSTMRPGEFRELSFPV